MFKSRGDAVLGVRHDLYTFYTHNMLILFYVLAISNQSIKFTTTFQQHKEAPSRTASVKDTQDRSAGNYEILPRRETKEAHGEAERPHSRLEEPGLFGVKTLLQIRRNPRQNPRKPSLKNLRTLI